MCRATWTESGCESQAGPMELWPEPVLIKTCPLWSQSEPLRKHAGACWTNAGTHGHSFHSVHALLTTTTGHPKMLIRP
jgi:hypothetical protein